MVDGRHRDKSLIGDIDRLRCRVMRQTRLSVEKIPREKSAVRLPLSDGVFRWRSARVRALVTPRWPRNEGCGFRNHPRELTALLL